MSLNVSYYLHNIEPTPKEVDENLKTSDDVDRFIDVVSDVDTSEAIVIHDSRPLRDTKIPDEKSPTGWLQMEDHYLAIFVEDGYGAILYSGRDGYAEKGVALYSSGDFANEPVDLESAFFPSYTFVPVDQLRAALQEFLVTAKRPLTITWRTENGEIIPTPQSLNDGR